MLIIALFRGICLFKNFGVARQLLPSIVCELNYLSRSFYLTTIAATYSPRVRPDATSYTMISSCHHLVDE
jgi:hypothetical protein